MIRNFEFSTKKSFLLDFKRHQILLETATSLCILEFTSAKLEFQDTKACRRFKEHLLLFKIKQKTFLRGKFKVSYESALSKLKSVLSTLDFSHIRSIWITQIVGLQNKTTREER